MTTIIAASLYSLAAAGCTSPKRSSLLPSPLHFPHVAVTAPAYANDNIHTCTLLHRSIPHVPTLATSTPFGATARSLVPVATLYRTLAIPPRLACHTTTFSSGIRLLATIYFKGTRSAPHLAKTVCSLPASFACGVLPLRIALGCHARGASRLYPKPMSRDSVPYVYVPRPTGITCSTQFSSFPLLHSRLCCSDPHW